jgi:hypothetical protein
VLLLRRLPRARNGMLFGFCLTITAIDSLGKDVLAAAAAAYAGVLVVLLDLCQFQVSLGLLNMY